MEMAGEGGIFLNKSNSLVVGSRMNCYFSSMKNLMKMLVGVVTVAAMSGVALADEQADRILAGTRYASTLQHQDLHGKMLKEGRTTPVSLFLRGEDIQFFYKVGAVEKRFHMRLANDHFDLLELVGGKTTRFSDTKLAEKINGTDLSYEDLAMSFLYWKNSKVMGEEKVNGQICHKLRLINPSSTAGDYRIVYVWVHKKYGALMKVVGYNRNGHPLKQFQVTDLMRVGKEYTLEKMRVDSIQPGENKVVGITYLEFERPRKVTAGSKPLR